MSRIYKNGISHRRLHLWLSLVVIIVSGAIIISTVKLTKAFLRVTTASEQFSELHDAALELMNASDYLTEQVQRFTLNGDKIFMDQYFTEAFESKRREEALSIMGTNPEYEVAYTKLQNAMDNSVKLMDQEYYAMRLVIEAKGYTDYPEVLRAVELSPEDAALSSEKKIRRANEMVLGNSYYEQKDKIRKNMEESLAEIDRLSDTYALTEVAKLKTKMNIARVAIIFQAVIIFTIMGLTSLLGINPKAYNKIYEKNKSSLEKLNFKASHDELTGAYNRAGYDYILSTIDLENTYMLLFDVDDFKTINDTYGHDTGDKALIKIVNTFKKVFRDDDCICRIGGDEFVVFLGHTGEISHSLIEFKINQISKFLGNTDDGLPPISISVGIVNGRNASGIEDLFEKSDKAMYESKMRGKHSFTFYSESNA